MDKTSGELANMLVGNDSNNKLIEATMVGPKLEFNKDITIAITGANMSPMVNGNPVNNNGALSIKQGSILSFGKLINGYRTYIAVSGSLTNSDNLVFKNGDEIGVEKINIKSTSPPNSKVGRVLKPTTVLDVFIAPEFDLLTEASKKEIFNTKFTIHTDSNRMGYRTNGEKLNLINDNSILTSSVQPGTVQLPPNGQPIILMRDCQTTGGYPRVLQLSESAINNIAQLKPGDKFSFKPYHHSSF